ncbi:hypothetical protein HN011_004728 [Eciton burchellii]|jgi:hypothetical protein|nr:hypothetical protein HN011_004728 [Eciton burchellii]
MSKVLQAKDVTYTNAVEHHVMDILNPTLHHHDYLQSYVRTRGEVSSDSKQDFVEFEEPTKDVHSNKYSTIANNENSNNCNNRYVYNKWDKNNHKKQKEKLDVITVESEMRIQKSKRK